VNSIFADESLTITTYYPSPYGSYNELSANKIKVGNTTVPAAAQSGMIRFENRMIQPAAAPSVEGAIYYNRIDKEFKYSDGSSWAALGGGGGCYVDYGLVIGLAVGDPCGAGFTVKKSAGKWGSCVMPNGLGSHFRPPSGGCLGGWGYAANEIGEAYVCCQ
jgi:hypothetical protein